MSHDMDLRIWRIQTIMSTESDNVQEVAEMNQVTENLIQAEVQQEGAADNVQESTVQSTGEATSLIEKKDDDVSTATIWSSVANMTNNVLGAGLVALPYSISQVFSLLLIRTSVLWFPEFFFLCLWPL